MEGLDLEEGPKIKHRIAKYDEEIAQLDNDLAELGASKGELEKALAGLGLEAHIHHKSGLTVSEAQDGTETVPLENGKRRLRESQG